MPGSGSAERKPLIDRVCVGTFSVVWILMILRFGPEMISPASQIGGLVILLSGIVAGYLLADLLAGVVHWIADRFFDRDTRVLGLMLIAPFREHHDDALGITRHDFFEVTGNNALVTIPVVLLVTMLPASGGSLNHFLLVLGASSTLFLVLTNQFHRWAHMPSPPRPVRWLHATGLVLTPRRHARHHRGDHDCAYCVTSGWLNPLLDRLRLFARLERALKSSRPPLSAENRPNQRKI